MQNFEKPWYYPIFSGEVYSRETSFARFSKHVGLFLIAATVLTSMSTNRCHADIHMGALEDRFEEGGRFELSPNFDYFTTSSNYDQAGASFYPTGFDQHTKFGPKLRFGLGIKDVVSFFAELQGHASMTKTTETSGGVTSTTTRTVYGPSDQHVGLTFRPFSGPGSVVHFDLQVEATFPAYSNTSAALNNRYFLGDGSYDFSFSAITSIHLFQKRSYRIILAPAAGFTFRTGGFSSHIPYSFSMRFDPPTNGFYLEALPFGIVSLASDTQTSSLGTDATISSLTSQSSSGGSFAINAINPSLFNLRGRMGYKFSPSVLAYLEATKSLWGLRTANFLAFGGGVSINFFLDSASSRQTTPTPGLFNNYDLSGKVIEIGTVSEPMIINLGTADGVTTGQLFDIFPKDLDPTKAIKSNEPSKGPVARAKVISAQYEESRIQIIDTYKEVWIQTGFLVKRVLE